MKLDTTISRKAQKLEYWISKRVGRAMGDFNMLSGGDRILVCVSGGKDSLTLLKVLVSRQLKVPIKHEIVVLHAVSSQSCGEDNAKKRLRDIFERLGVEYYFAPMQIELQDRKKKQGLNCFWCSWNRKKIFFEWARKLNCNKIALGHHKDDIVETTLMNLFFQGEFSTMMPNQPFFKGKFRIIRPLCYVEEVLIAEYAGEAGFIANNCICPFGENSNRKRIKEFLQQTEKTCPGVKNNIFYAPGRINEEYLPFMKSQGHKDARSQGRG